MEGEDIITITTQKTGQTVSIPLFSIPKALLLKYNFAAPKISNQKMNDYLKELGQLVGMDSKIMVIGNKAGKRTDEIVEKWEKFTTHVARRSFATNFYLEGTPISDLMQITGHTTERQFMQYIVIDGKMNAARFSEKRKARTLKIAG
jgi:integrase